MKRIPLILLVIIGLNTATSAQNLIAGKINANTMPGYYFSNWTGFSTSSSILFQKTLSASGYYDMTSLILGENDLRFIKKIDAGYEKGVVKENTVAQTVMYVCDTLYYIKRGRDLKNDRDIFYHQDMLKQLTSASSPLYMLDSVPYALNRVEDAAYATSPNGRNVLIASLSVKHKKDTVKSIFLTVVDSLFHVVRKGEIVLPHDAKSVIECKVALTNNGTVYLWCSARKSLGSQLSYYLYKFDASDKNPQTLALPENSPALKFVDRLLVKENSAYLIFKPVGTQGNEYTTTAFRFSDNQTPLRIETKLTLKDFLAGSENQVFICPQLRNAYITNNWDLILAYDVTYIKTEMRLPVAPGQMGTTDSSFRAVGVCVIGFAKEGAELFRTTLARNQAYAGAIIPLVPAVSFQANEIHIAWANYTGNTLKGIYAARLDYSGKVLNSATLSVPPTHSGLYLNGSLCAWNSQSNTLGLLTEAPGRINYSILKVQY